MREYWLIGAGGPQIVFEILENRGTQFVPTAGPGALQTSHVLGGLWTLGSSQNRAVRFSDILDHQSS